MVLGQPGAVEAQFLSVEDLFRGLVEHFLGGGSLRPGDVGKQAEFHY